MSQMGWTRNRAVAGRHVRQRQARQAGWALASLAVAGVAVGWGIEERRSLADH